jgi:hypothetical protein
MSDRCGEEDRRGVPYPVLEDVQAVRAVEDVLQRLEVTRDRRIGLEGASMWVAGCAAATISRYRTQGAGI